jgi:hypothetical protein
MRAVACNCPQPLAARGRWCWSATTARARTKRPCRLRAAIDDGAQVVLQGNSSATAAVLIEAINKHNEREPGKRVLFLNYSAVDPILTNEKCSFWHFPL